MSSKAKLQTLFLKSVEDYHASYMSSHWWPDVLYEENKEVIEKINLRMGYRMQLNAISWPEEVNIRVDSLAIP